MKTRLLRCETTGIGIPADALPRVFDMFSQVDRSIERATGGLGIGLALGEGLGRDARRPRNRPRAMDPEKGAPSRSGCRPSLRSLSRSHDTRP